MSNFVDNQYIGAFSIGEIPEPIRITIQNSSGTAIDLTGYTAKFIIEAVDADTPATVGAGTSTLPDDANGITQYAWVAADFAQAGHYRAQMWVGNGTYRYSSDLFEYFVRDATTAPSI